jgi:hypothetical protein
LVTGLCRQERDQRIRCGNAVPVFLMKSERLASPGYIFMGWVNYKSNDYRMRAAT